MSGRTCWCLWCDRHQHSFLSSTDKLHVCKCLVPERWPVGWPSKERWVSGPWDDHLWCSITLFEALTSNMFLHPLVLPLSSDSEWAKPALLMQTSTPPCCCLIAANMDTISSSFVRSHLNGNRMPLRPSPRHSDASFWNESQCQLFFFFFKKQKHVLFQETQKLAVKVVTALQKILHVYNIDCRACCQLKLG